jgi:hypothetical protein
MSDIGSDLRKSHRQYIIGYRRYRTNCTQPRATAKPATNLSLATDPRLQARLGQRLQALGTKENSHKLQDQEAPTWGHRCKNQRWQRLQVSNYKTIGSRKQIYVDCWLDKIIWALAALSSKVETPETTGLWLHDHLITDSTFYRGETSRDYRS